METVIDLVGKDRELDRIRLVSSMHIRGIQQKNMLASPVELVGSPFQAIALIDLLWATAPKGRFCVMIGDLKGMPKNPGLRAEPELVSKLNNCKGFIEVDTEGEIYTLFLNWDSESNLMSCNFGYAVTGLRLRRNANGQVDVFFAKQETMESVVDLSLFKLYEMTGNTKFLHPIGARKKMVALGMNHIQSNVVDPLGYFQILGLNPLISKFMTREMIQSMIKFIKRGLSSSLHSDMGGNNSSDKAYLQNALEAAEFLSEDSNWKQYVNWL